jgi:predicted hydrolase (HD superfamily)
MTPYDPDQTPEAGAWLALDESERIGRITAHHAAAGITPPNARLHAALHAVGSVLVAHLTARMGRPGKSRAAVDDYVRKLHSLTAEGWREHARQKRTI